MNARRSCPIPRDPLRQFGPKRHRGGLGRPLRGVLLLFVIAAALSTAYRAAEPGGAETAPAAAKTPEWLTIEYGDLVDRRALSHSGESVASLLKFLAGRPVPPPGERRDDALAHAELEPMLEPYGFVLSDTLETIRPAGTRPFVEIGSLWAPGGAEPAWVELLRSRRFILESDGAGAIRALLPVAGSPAPAGSLAAATEAWRGAWPVIRHAVAGEQARLAAAAGDKPADHPISISVWPWAAEQASTRFRLGTLPYETRVTDTRSIGSRSPLDLEALSAFLQKGLQLEGARLEGDGALRLFGSARDQAPTLLGRPVSLADLAVAGRAIFHGGAAEPYMSLDRADAPQRSFVNYGGRLRDTTLGFVSLLCDIRFKTFSLGIDPGSLSDDRARAREAFPAFRTHLERFAADTGSKGVMSQQTRLWFYPDTVDLTLSPDGDVLAMRRVRMSAAAERLGGAPGSDPPWTKDTVGGINTGYDALARVYPELADLDQTARLLALFAWLRQAETDGLRIPDVDALLAVPLPARPTPRSYPQLLTLDAIPAPGGSGVVDVFTRAPVAVALDRLQPPPGRPLPAQRRLARALSALDPRIPDQAALAKEIEAVKTPAQDDGALDSLAQRAERLVMHHLVITTPAADARAKITARRSADAAARVFSIGIGGLDLGMSQPLARAARRSERISLGGAGGARSGSATAPDASGRGGSNATAAPRTPAPIADPPSLTVTRLPVHGASTRSAQAPSTSSGQGVWSAPAVGPAPAWSLEAYGLDGLDMRWRRAILVSTGPQFERVEDGRCLRYRLVPEGAILRARPLSAADTQGWPAPPTVAPLPATPPAAPGAPGVPALDPVPEGVVVISLPEEPAADPALDAPALRVRLRATTGGEAKDLTASVPRPILRRLLLGHEADLAAGQPLRGLSPLPPAAGAARRVLVMTAAAEAAPPWTAPAPIPGEEMAARLAPALTAWWEGDPATQGLRAAVGTDLAASPRRIASAPAADKAVFLLVPDDAFPDTALTLRDRIRAAWGSRASGAALPAAAPPLVVLVSGEGAGALASRLRSLARDPALRGKQLAVVSLASGWRPDLPGSLLAERSLAGLGFYQASPVGVTEVPALVGRIGAALDSAQAAGIPVLDLPVPLTWYY